ncbi:MAG: ABC transporter ATP-binding protein [Candidatus Methanoplasma sp.]|jgi:ABC-2 type transport system ATP-binding protein|nr:ABC transporter ATP-binding protein [Candidatus Methanoplasma sp.]
MSSDVPIEIVGLRKEYGAFVAVNNLDLSIKKNSFTGFLGPNGAGKSTTLKILTHLIAASAGRAYINGVDVASDPKNALTGVGTVVETPEFYSYLTPRETLRYIGEIIGLTSESISSDTDAILEKVKMAEWADKRIGTFSKGMRQRIAIGQSLLGDPNLIILDEPTSGLDPRGMAETREILKNLRNDSHDLTVVMSSHLLNEVGDLCDRVALINHGTLLIHDDIDALSKAGDARRLTVKVASPPTKESMDRVAALDNVKSVERYGNDMEVHLTGGMDARVRFMGDLAGLGVGAYSVYEEDSLETTYLSLIKESR